MGKQRELHPLGKPKLLLDPFFVSANFFIETCVLNRDRRLTREKRQQLLVFFGERVELGALQVEHTDASILDEHRDDELRSRVGNEIDVARVLRDVGHQDRLLVQCRPAHEAFSELHTLDVASSPYRTASFMSSC